MFNYILTLTVHKNILRLLLLLCAFPVASFAQADSFQSVLERARQGNADDQNEVGIMYSEGTGVKPDQRAAVFWFKKSAEQGYSLGACNLGLHYGHGLGILRNRTLLMQWVFIAHSLDGLKCNPSDSIEMFKPDECQVEKGWELAVAWLREHPDFKNGFGERPWMELNGEYPITVRERGASIKLPIKRKKKCR